MTLKTALKTVILLVLQQQKGVHHLEMYHGERGCCEHRQVEKRDELKQNGWVGLMRITFEGLHRNFRGQHMMGGRVGVNYNGR